MESRQLGTDGPDLSVIGLGAWALGGGGWFASWGPQDDDLSVRTIERALDDGITWIDTAPIYGLGHSEAIVGKAVRHRRDDVFLATKVTNRWKEDRSAYRSGAPASIREEVEGSLRRLDVTEIDLLQIHAPVEDTPIEETWTEMAKLRSEGKVRFLGLSNCTVEHHERCEAIQHIDSTQPHYNLLLRKIEADLLPYCRANGIGVIPYGPMYEGLLSGSFDMARLSEEDFRRKDGWTKPREKAAAAVERLRPIADERGATVGQLAIAWVIATPGITSAIVGARSPEQVAQNVAAADLATDAALRAEIDASVADLVGEGS